MDVERRRAFLFLRRLLRICKKHPLIHYHIYSGDAERVMERLDKGLIDFGLLVGLSDVATYDLVYNAVQFVKKGFGYVIALDKLINTTGYSNLCFKPLSPTLDVDLYIVWKKYQVLSRASNTLLGQLQKELEYYTSQHPLSSS